jgi:hypothetical protein
LNPEFLRVCAYSWNRLMESLTRGCGVSQRYLGAQERLAKTHARGSLNPDGSIQPIAKKASAYTGY